MSPLLGEATLATVAPNAVVPRKTISPSLSPPKCPSEIHIKPYQSLAVFCAHVGSMALVEPFVRNLPSLKYFPEARA